LFAVEVEGVGFGEDRRVAAGGGQPQEELGASGQLHAAHARGLRRHPPPDTDGGIEAQGLLDRRRDRRGIGDHPFPARAILEQAPRDVADEVVRRLVAREAQREEDRGDLVERERLGILVVDVDQRARQVVGAALLAIGHQGP
jgi:hypothetical protein